MVGVYVHTPVMDFKGRENEILLWFSITSAFIV